MLLPNERPVSLLEVLVRFMLAIALVHFVAGAFGCGGPPKIAQQVLTTTSLALVKVDKEVSPRARAAATAAMAAALELEERAAAIRVYDEAMHPWVTVDRVMRESRDALLALQAAFDAWEVGADDGRDRWLRAAACALPILMRLADVLLRAGIEIPDKLDTAMSLIAPFAEDQCLDALEGVPR